MHVLEQKKSKFTACKITFVLLLLLGGCTTTKQQTNSDAGPPPNIVLIVAEDMSAKVRAFGDNVANTPTIDGLAADGVRYPNFFTTAGVCSPSRSALITGVYQTSMGTHQMRTRGLRGQSPSIIPYDAVPPSDVKAFPELLRRAGYATGNVAKRDYQFGHPFTIWDIHAGNAFTLPDLALWRKLPQDKPFFVMVNLMSTHESRLIGSDASGLPPRFGQMAKQVTQLRQKLVLPVTDQNDIAVPPYLPDTPKVRASIAQHYDNIHYMDKEVAQILENLEADGLTDNTIIIWTTDHGDAFPRAKRAVYDSGIKVPLIIRYPDHRDAGSLREEMYSFVDIAPTILGLAGLESPDFIQGQNLLARLEGRDHVYAARDRMDAVRDRVRATRDDRYKYIRNYQTQDAYFRPLSFRDMFPIMQELWDGHKAGTLTPAQKFYFKATRPVEELYDIQEDPHEVNNLADDPAYAAALSRLSKALDTWTADVGDKGEMPELEMVAEMWPNLEQPVTSPPQITVTDGQVTLSGTTAGSSIGFKIDDGSWQLYAAPVKLTTGQRFEAKAIRYGYQESETVFVVGKE